MNAKTSSNAPATRRRRIRATVAATLLGLVATVAAAGHAYGYSSAAFKPGFTHPSQRIMFHSGFHDGHSHDGYGHGYHGPNSGHVHPGFNGHVYAGGPHGPGSLGPAIAPNTPLVVKFAGGDFHPSAVPPYGHYAPIIAPEPGPHAWPVSPFHP